MDYFTVVLVLLLYFIRPQDWVPGLIGVGIVNPIMAWAVIAMIARARIQGRSLRLLLTPQDWAMLAFYIFIVVNHPDPGDTWKNALPLFAFYFVTVQALDSTDRLKRYLRWWLIALVVLTLFGVGSKYGFDPTGAVAMTESQKGRLALGTWMHNNPNALGHSVVAIFPLAYFLLFWKAGVGSRVMAAAMWVLAFECVWQTESKGAVLAGFAMLVLAYVFGRSRIVQILVLAVAVAGGGAAISVMPRMEQMGSLRSDEGVQGRLLAWEQARTASRNSFTGQGWKTFKATIKWEKEWIPKATHSGFVQVGAELGPLGMAIYVGILWLGFRTLLRCGPLELQAERSRRCLFALLVGFAISNWMIDRAYHTEFFLFMAATSALHRLKLLKAAEPHAKEAETVAEPVLAPVALWNLAPQPLMAMSTPSTSLSLGWTGADQPVMGRPSPPKRERSLNRPGIVDYIAAGCGAWLVFYLWDYILKNL